MSVCSFGTSACGVTIADESIGYVVFPASDPATSAHSKRGNAHDAAIFPITTGRIDSGCARAKPPDALCLSPH